VSRTTHSKRAGQAGIVMAASLALGLAVPAAHAADVDLGVAQPFVVLGGESVTNTGPSVLNGDLGVSTGSSLVGFGSPAVVTGATHVDDEVAANAQAAALRAYDAAAGEPVPDGNVLTGQDLGNRVLTPGAYRFASSAQLTGELTLDAEGDPDAQFVFQIGSTLTTASASSVRLVGGASPCNVFWQVGSSATIGSTTAMQGNVLAKVTASLDSEATVLGRVLAQTGSVTLINNRLDASMCHPPVTTPGAGDDDDDSGNAGGSGGPSGGGTTGGPAGDTRGSAVTTAGGGATGGGTAGGGPAGDAPGLAGFPAGVPTTRLTLRRTPRANCAAGFRVSVRGANIARVDFRLDGRRIGGRGKAAAAQRQVDVQAAPGAHTITARVTFKDGARSRTMKLDYRACAAAQRRVRRGPSRFTG
jgi:hypothetical protein